MAVYIDFTAALQFCYCSVIIFVTAALQRRIFNQKVRVKYGVCVDFKVVCN
jgi:hypothetical protein